MILSLCNSGWHNDDCKALYVTIGENQVFVDTENEEKRRRVVARIPPKNISGMGSLYLDCDTERGRQTLKSWGTRMECPSFSF